MLMSNILIPVFVGFVGLYVLWAIVFDRRRARLAREREAEQEAKRERQWLAHQSMRPGRMNPATPAAFDMPTLRPDEPTEQDTAWLNTWLTDDYHN
jgi:flagellar biosynthesis/type III secretory pathway M-ring protein FliF/YscJ